MPGLLSSIFDAGSGSDDEAFTQPDRGQAPDTGDEGGESQASNHHAGADGDLDLAPSITIGNTMSGSYETPDGTTHGWERTDEVTLTTDTQIVTAVDTMLTVEDASF